MTLTFDLLTSQSIGVIYRLGPTFTASMKFLGISVLELLNKKHFSAEGYCDLDV